MLGELVRKEMQERLLNPAYVITLGFCSILILLSFYTGLRNYTEHLNENNAIQKYHQRILSLQKSYYDVDMLGVQVSQPANPLSTVASGVSNSLGRHATIKMNEPPTITGSKPESNPVFAIFETFDLLFVVKNVLSLVAILFTYNAICGEKENGTLRLMLSFAVPKDQLILSKMVGGFLCLVVPLGVPVLLGVGLMTVFPSVHLSGEDWLRLVCLLGVLGLYVSVFFALGLCVSSCVTRSSASLLVLLSVWVVCVLVIPQGSAILAGQFVNITSKQVEKLELTYKRLLWDREKEEAQAEFYKQNPEPIKRLSVEQQKQDQVLFEQDPDKWFENTMRRQSEAHSKPVYKKWNKKREIWLDQYRKRKIAEWDLTKKNVIQTHQNERQKLLSIATWLSRISPAAGVTYGGIHLAGTGAAHQQGFFHHILIYQSAFETYIKEKRALESLGTGLAFDGSSFAITNRNEAVDTSDLPAFGYPEIPFGQTLRDILLDCGLMVVYVLIFFVIAYVAFLRYDVR